MDHITIMLIISIIMLVIAVVETLRLVTIEIIKTINDYRRRVKK